MNILYVSVIIPHLIDNYLFIIAHNVFIEI